MTPSQTHARPEEGYVYSSFGGEQYLRDAIVAASTVRRFDSERPISLVCSAEHIALLQTWQSELNLRNPFSVVIQLHPEHASLVGYKHHLHEYMPFKRNLYLDSDTIWCRDPQAVWHALRPYAYTATGLTSADMFFGSHKNFGVVFDILLRRRQRTLRRFGLSHLVRLQSGVIYISDEQTARRVGQQASEFLSRKAETHFVSRKREQGRTHESSEWSMAMAVSKLGLFVYPWFNAQESIQLDFIEPYTRFNEDFTRVSCKYYCHPFIYSFRGIKGAFGRGLLFFLFSYLPRRHDHLWVTPYLLHFGWNHEKHHFRGFVERQWRALTSQE